MQALLFAVLLSLSPGKAPMIEAPAFKTLEVPACAETTGNPFALCRYGTRSEIIAGEQKITPLYAIVAKNTNHAEELSSSWMKYFAEYALDGEIFVRLEDDSVDSWKVVAYHRPKDADQAGAWSKDKTLFSEEKSGDRSILPAPIRALPDKSFAKVWHLVHYFDGSAKVYLQPGTTAGEAAELLRALPGAR